MKKLITILFSLLLLAACEKEEKGLTGEWATEVFWGEATLSISEEKITVVWYKDQDPGYSRTSNTYDILYITDNEIKIRLSTYDARVIRYSLDGDKLFFIDNTSNSGIYDSRYIYTRQ